MHLGDHRLRNPLQCEHHVAAAPEQAADERLVAVREHLLQVVARTERAARAGDDDDTHARIVADRHELALERLEQAGVERVELGGTVERERRDAAGVIVPFEGCVGVCLIGCVHGRTFVLDSCRLSRWRHSIACTEPARSRNRNFWILPVDVFGSSPNTTLFGTLKRAR